MIYLKYSTFFLSLTLKNVFSTNIENCRHVATLYCYIIFRYIANNTVCRTWRIITFCYGKRVVSQNGKGTYCFRFRNPHFFLRAAQYLRLTDVALSYLILSRWKLGMLVGPQFIMSYRNMGFLIHFQLLTKLRRLTLRLSVKKSSDSLALRN